MSVKGIKKRSWSVEEKRMIVSQSLMPGVSVSQVARRYNVNANLVFKWLRDPRFNIVTAAPDFLPVAVAEEPGLILQEPTAVAEGEAPPSCAAGRIVVCVAGGHRLEISGAFDGHAVAQLLKGLSS
jgi:transposase